MTGDPQTLRLTDAQWSHLAKIVALPEHARGELENILGLGKFLAGLDATETAPSMIKRRLAALRRKAETLARLLRSIDAETMMSLISPVDLSNLANSIFPPPLLTASKNFEAHIASVEALSAWIGRAEARTAKGKTGDKTSGAQKIAQGVKELLEKHTSHRLSTGEKVNDPARDFLGECFKAANVQVTPEAILRRVSMERRRKVSA